jgi:hypothetical protein
MRSVLENWSTAVGKGHPPAFHFDFFIAQAASGLLALSPLLEESSLSPPGGGAPEALELEDLLSSESLSAGVEPKGVDFFAIGVP